MKVVLASGDFSSGFNRAWNRSEAALRFVREEEGYLRRKGLRFGDPRCYLVAGYNLTEAQRDKVRTKTRMNPSIQLLTYNDLLVWMKATVELIRTLGREGKIPAEAAKQQPAESQQQARQINITVAESIVGSQIQQGTTGSVQAGGLQPAGRPGADGGSSAPGPSGVVPTSEPELTEAQRSDYRRNEYQCYDRIGFPGTLPAGRSDRLLVNGAEAIIAESSFVLLLRLAVELKKGEGGWVNVHDLESEGFAVSAEDRRAWSRLRTQLQGFLLASAPKKFIENNKAGGYRISTHPDFVTYAKERLLTHPSHRVKELAKSLP